MRNRRRSWQVLITRNQSVASRLVASYLVGSRLVASRLFASRLWRLVCISSGGISSPNSALDALPVLMTELSGIVRRRIVLDAAFCTQLSLLCEAYDATLHGAHGEQSPIDRLIHKLAKASTMYWREWASVVTRWQQGSAVAISTAKGLAVLFAYTMELVPIFLLLSLDGRIAATIGRPYVNYVTPSF